MSGHTLNVLARGRRLEIARGGPDWRWPMLGIYKVCKGHQSRQVVNGSRMGVYEIALQLLPMSNTCVPNVRTVRAFLKRRVEPRLCTFGEWQELAREAKNSEEFRFEID